MDDKNIAINTAINPSEAIKRGAITDQDGAAYSDGNVVVSTAVNHMAVAFNNTTYNQNQLIVLQKRDAEILISLMVAAARKRGWLS